MTLDVKRLLGRKFRSDERGSAMTEFVIGLPVFIMLFLGILNLMSLGIGSVLVKGRAHSKMWVKAIDIQTRYVPEWSTSPVSAAAQAALFHRETGGSALDYALDSADGVAAATGLSGGIMAHSYSRVKPVDIVENIGIEGEEDSLDNNVTWNINESYIISEDDSIANSLMNDAIDYGSFSSITGGGVLGALNGVVDFAGMRPAIAAGVRYGISGDFQRDTVTVFGGIPVTMEARSHVANAPRPTSRYITFAVVRLAMEKDDHYDTAIAFRWVPEFESANTYDMGTEAIAQYEDCQNANAQAEADGTATTDCGDEPAAESNSGGDEDEMWTEIGGCRGSWCR